MLISTKGRYALRVLIELAEAPDLTVYKRLDSIADNQGISEKYLESIVNLLMKAKLIEGMRGRGGGYRLTKAPADYSVGEVLRVTDGSLAPVSCLECQNGPCVRESFCKTLPMWKHLDNLINNYVDGLSLLDLVNGDVDK
ncbi:MAG: Rrf2 family transcriptional regulator [Phascolarctobacterium sp.]|nr:Rrf2 family transcriptional regulator [Phascolarctobacterium sp.]